MGSACQISTSVQVESIAESSGFLECNTRTFLRGKGVQVDLRADAVENS